MLYIPSEYLHAVTIYVIFEKQGPCPRHDTRAAIPKGLPPEDSVVLTPSDIYRFSPSGTLYISGNWLLIHPNWDQLMHLDHYRVGSCFLPIFHLCLLSPTHHGHGSKTSWVWSCSNCRSSIRWLLSLWWPCWKESCIWWLQIDCKIRPYQLWSMLILSATNLK